MGDSDHPLPDIYSSDIPPSYSITQSLAVSSKDALLNFLLEPSNLPLMHPLIQSVKAESGVKESGVKNNQMIATSMTITDKITICGCWSYSTRYRAIQWWQEEAFVIYWKANAAGGVVVYNRFDIEEREGGLGQVIVTQSTWIKAPWLLKGYVIRTAKKAHEESLANLSCINI